MDSALEERLRDIIQKKTSTIAKQEWIDSQKKTKKPLYNYRFNHVELVVELAQYLANKTDANYELITLAAWLHDAAKPGLGGVSNHGEKSARIAREVLLDEGFNKKTIDLVCDSIRKHVGLTLDRQLESLEAQILWDADKLLKLGIIGFIHFIVNGIRIKPGMNIEEIAKKTKEYLPLAEKIVDSMNTSQGRKIAKERLQILYSISNELEKELKFRS